MVDKVQKIRKEVERIQLYTQSEVLKQVLDYIDKVQKEPVSILHNASEEYPLTGKEIIVLKNDKIYYGKYVDGFHNGYVLAEIQLIDGTAQTYAITDYLIEKDKWIYVEDLLNLFNVQRTVKNCGEPVSEDLEDASRNYADDEEYGDDIYFAIKAAFKEGANWQKQQDFIPSTELSNFIDKLSKQFPEVSFAKLSRIAVRVAKWQQQQEYTCYEEAFEDGAKWKAEQFEKNRLKHCNSITNEQAELEQGFIDQHLDKYQRMPTFLDAIEYGMKMQKEQMMKGAVESTVYNKAYPTEFEIETNTFMQKLKHGDKVKVIVIKED